MKEELKKRNKRYAIGIINLMRSMPHDRIFDSLVRQVVRSSTSVGANYRAACRAKSTADFLNKLKIVEEEADESVYWLELIKAYNGINNPEYEVILNESKELE